MMSNDGDINTRRDSEEPQAPAKLVAALKEPLSRRVFVPSAVDQAILRAACKHLEKAPSPAARRFRNWLFWPAMAAACLALVALIHFFAKPSGGTTTFAREDINRDGQVDILDAFQFA